MVSENNQWWQDDREVAELIWCMAHLDRIIAPPSSQDIEEQDNLHHSHSESSPENLSEDHTNIPPSETVEQQIPIATHRQQSSDVSTSPEPESSSNNCASPVRVPDPFPLPKPAEISKALLPLSKRIPGLLANELDIDATVEQTSEANGLPILAFRPPLERWFEVHLLIDRSPSMAFWGDLAEGVATLFRWQGFFRDVRIWQFETSNPEPQLFSGVERIERDIRSLIAPGRHRLFIVLTDTLGKAWYSGEAFEVLAELGERHPVSIAHIFPQPLWQRTGLDQAIQRPLIARQSELANSRLQVGARLRTKAGLYRFPIFNLSVNHFTTWANFTTGSGSNSIQGVLIRQEQPEPIKTNPAKQHQPELVLETPEQLLRGFFANASSDARKLAEVLAAVPLIPPVMRLAQRQFLPNSEHWHLAEVFFSGLLQKSSLGPEEATVAETWYEFQPGIRELLLGNSPVQRTTEIWREIGDFIQRRYGYLRDFQALIPNPDGSFQGVAADPELYFAEVEAAVLTTWGGEYANIAQQLSEKVAERKQQKDEIRQQTVNLTDNLEPFEFEAEVAIIIFEEKPDEDEEKLQQWTFETPTVNRRGEITKTTTYTASYFAETLTDGVELEMVAIPGGTFTMGSPEREKDSYDNERPQHDVTLQPFFMGKYPVTQAQWKAIASRTDLKVERDLDLDPSRFKEDPSPSDFKLQTSDFADPHQPPLERGEKAKTRWDRPVENVNWYEAVEFCQRLSKLTGREYRLPSEAQWEYACRGVTEPLNLENGESYPPFYFGETITGQLANYRASRTYADEPEGERSKETTPVGQFPPNPFGLYDMHGNVWEWCADEWHENYENAPTDGSAWIDSNQQENVKAENQPNSAENDENQVNSPLRGGSWDSNPDYCRSAIRLDTDRRDYRFDYVGFRVVCVAGRTL